jgi:hypothetical protein
MHQHPDTPRCVNCHHEIPAWDLPRYACGGCQASTSDRLAELPDLLAALPAMLTLGSGAPGVGSRHAAAGSRPPISLRVVDLTMQVPAVLDSWARDWADVGGLQRPTVGTTASWLRWHLDWACRQHPAIDEFMHEIATLYAQIDAATGGYRPERAVPVRCPCGGTIPWRVSRDHYRCHGCGERYDRDTAAALPMAPRTRAMPSLAR